jgi:hypothetical protein
MKDIAANSKIYSSTWLKHFGNGLLENKFNFIDKISFVKNKILPIYINVGKNLSLGISYSKPLNGPDETAKKLKNGVILIYHVPTYYSPDFLDYNNAIGLHKIYDSTGYLIDFKSFDNLDSYLTATLSQSRIKKIQRNKRLLESRHDISYKWYYGEISETEYEKVFESFRKLLEKRYDDKQEYNRHLNDNIWNFYHELFFPLINTKNASFYIIYNGSEPISICFNYNTPDSIKGAISVFDIDFAKYEIGNMYLTNQFEICFENNIRIFDLGLGNYGYKNRWSTDTYTLDHHVFYNKNSIISRTLAKGMQKYFQTKLELKKKGLKNIFVKNQNVQIE